MTVKPPRPDGHPSVGGESPQPKPPRQAAPATPPMEGNNPATNSPPMGGNDRDGFPSCGGVPRRGGVVLEGRSAIMRATQKYKSLPFNPALKNRAKALRKAGLLHEALLWLELKNKKLNTLDFDRQKIIGNYIVDFYCAEKGVVIEVDGCSHDHKQPEDALRDQYLNSLGLVVIRLLAKDVLQNRQGVVTLLRNHPALTGTTPQPKPPRQAAPATPPMEGNNPATNSPPVEGCPAGAGWFSKGRVVMYA